MWLLHDRLSSVAIGRLFDACAPSTARVWMWVLVIAENVLLRARLQTLQILIPVLRSADSPQVSLVWFARCAVHMNMHVSVSAPTGAAACCWYS